MPSFTARGAQSSYSVHRNRAAATVERGVDLPQNHTFTTTNTTNTNSALCRGGSVAAAAAAAGGAGCGGASTAAMNNYSFSSGAAANYYDGGQCAAPTPTRRVGGGTNGAHASNNHNPANPNANVHQQSSNRRRRESHRRHHRYGRQYNNISNDNSHHSNIGHHTHHYNYHQQNNTNTGGGGATGISGSRASAVRREETRYFDALLRQADDLPRLLSGALLGIMTNHRHTNPSCAPSMNVTPQHRPHQQPYHSSSHHHHHSAASPPSLNEGSHNDVLKPISLGPTDEQVQQGHGQGQQQQHRSGGGGCGRPSLLVSPRPTRGDGAGTIIASFMGRGAKEDATSAKAIATATTKGSPHSFDEHEGFGLTTVMGGDGGEKAAADHRTTDLSPKESPHPTTDESLGGVGGGGGGESSSSPSPMSAAGRGGSSVHNRTSSSVGGALLMRQHTDMLSTNNNINDNDTVDSNSAHAHATHSNAGRQQHHSQQHQPRPSSSSQYFANVSPASGATSAHSGTPLPFPSPSSPSSHNANGLHVSHLALGLMEGGGGGGGGPIDSDTLQLMGSVAEHLGRVLPVLCKRLPEVVSPIVIVGALRYLAVAQSLNVGRVEGDNWFRLFLTAIMVSAKMHLDSGRRLNGVFAKVLEVDCAMLNTLEVELLYMLDFNLLLCEHEYNDYCVWLVDVGRLQGMEDFTFWWLTALEEYAFNVQRVSEPITGTGAPSTPTHGPISRSTPMTPMGLGAPQSSAGRFGSVSTSPCLGASGGIPLWAAGGSYPPPMELTPAAAEPGSIGGYRLDKGTPMSGTPIHSPTPVLTYGGRESGLGGGAGGSKGSPHRTVASYHMSDAASSHLNLFANTTPRLFSARTPAHGPAVPWGESPFTTLGHDDPFPYHHDPLRAVNDTPNNANSGMGAAGGASVIANDDTDDEDKPLGPPPMLEVDADMTPPAQAIAEGSPDELNSIYGGGGGGCSRAAYRRGPAMASPPDYEGAALPRRGGGGGLSQPHHLATHSPPSAGGGRAAAGGGGVGAAMGSPLRPPSPPTTFRRPYGGGNDRCDDYPCRIPAGSNSSSANTMATTTRVLRPPSSMLVHTSDLMAGMATRPMMSSAVRGGGVGGEDSAPPPPRRGFLAPRAAAAPNAADGPTSSAATPPLLASTSAKDATGSFVPVVKDATPPPQQQQQRQDRHPLSMMGGCGGGLLRKSSSYQILDQFLGGDGDDDDDALGGVVDHAAFKGGADKWKDLRTVTALNASMNYSINTAVGVGGGSLNRSSQQNSVQQADGGSSPTPGALPSLELPPADSANTINASGIAAQANNTVHATSAPPPMMRQNTSSPPRSPMSSMSLAQKVADFITSQQQQQQGGGCGAVPPPSPPSSVGSCDGGDDTIDAMRPLYCSTAPPSGAMADAGCPPPPPLVVNMATSTMAVDAAPPSVRIGAGIVDRSADRSVGRGFRAPRMGSAPLAVSPTALPPNANATGRSAAHDESRLRVVPMNTCSNGAAAAEGGAGERIGLGLRPAGNSGRGFFAGRGPPSAISISSSAGAGPAVVSAPASSSCSSVGGGGGIKNSGRGFFAKKSDAPFVVRPAVGAGEAAVGVGSIADASVTNGAAPPNFPTALIIGGSCGGAGGGFAN